MEIEILENAIIAQIESLGIVAKPYPENPSSYIPDAYPGEVLVRYTGCKYSKRDVSTVNYTNTQVVDLVYISQQLRGDQGIFKWLDRIRRHLDGYTLPGVNAHLEMTTEDYLDEYNGTWQYGQKWQLETAQNNEQEDNYADYPIGAQIPRG